MIQINLLPVRAKKRRDTSRQFIGIYFLSLALVLAGIGYVWVSQASEIRNSETRLKSLETEVARYAAYEKMLKDLEKRKELADKKRSVIEELQKDRDKMVRLLAMLSVEIPSDRLWLQKLSQNASTVNVDGVALSNETIAEFMRNLEGSPYVENGTVSLTHSRRISMGDMKLREFQLTLRFVPYSGVAAKLAAQNQPASDTQKTQ